MKKEFMMQIYKAYTAVMAFVLGMIPLHVFAADRTWPWTRLAGRIDRAVTNNPRYYGYRYRLCWIVYRKCRRWGSEIPCYYSCNLNCTVCTDNRFLDCELINEFCFHLWAILSN